MDVKALQENWERFGQTDPLWAILTDPAKKGRRWAPSGFFETGRQEIEGVMAYLRSLPIVMETGQALDFGCGVGRLTQALCEVFDECHGVDIAPSMIALANRYNRFGSKARYHLNDRLDLSLFSDNTFDFIYSNLVLQHMEPEYSAGYIREFIRVLKPGGIALFQLPSEPNNFDPNSADPLQPLPLSGFRAYIQIKRAPPKMEAGVQATITARVQNASDVVWPDTAGLHDRGRIRLGNHWLDARGRTVRNDDGRSPLPHPLNPGEAVEIPLTIRAPQESGRYLLELDMVQEHVCWFQSRGSPTARVRVRVTGGRPLVDFADFDRPGLARRALKRIARLFSQSGPEPVMEMHGISQPQVVALIGSAGGRLVDVQRFDVAGESWISYRYCVTKPA